MLIKMLSRMASPDRVSHVGEVIDVDDAEANRLIQGGYAQPVALSVDSYERAVLTEGITPETPRRRSK